uniref:Uncharacterized protein n=1 Tax=Tetranychus urticae TaxID=32264 RepID=T1K8E8_TETUR
MVTPALAAQIALSKDHEIFTFKYFLTFLNSVISLAAFIFFLVIVFDEDKKGQQYFNFSYIGGDATSVAAYYLLYGAIGIYGSLTLNPNLIKTYMAINGISIGVRLATAAMRAQLRLEPQLWSFAFLFQEALVILVSLPVLSSAEAKARRR